MNVRCANGTCQMIIDKDESLSVKNSDGEFFFCSETCHKTRLDKEVLKIFEKYSPFNAVRRAWKPERQLNSKQKNNTFKGDKKIKI